MKVKTNSLKTYEKNPRKGDIKTIKDSLVLNGQYKPIVVREETKEILAGNHTYLAAVELGWEEIEVHYVSSLTDDEAKRIVLVDNRASDLGTYESGGKVVLDLLKELGNLQGTGYDDTALKDLQSRFEEKQKVKSSELMDESEIRVKQGQTWKLGKHRLHVGSCTELSSWELLFQGTDRRTDLLLTDPPYNVDYKGSTKNPRHDSVLNDKFDTEDSYYAFLLEFASHAFNYSKEGAPVYWFYISNMAVPNIQAFEGAGFHYSHALVWAKNTFMFGRNDYQHSYEPLLYGWKQGKKHTWMGDRKQRTVIEGYGEDFDPQKLSKKELLEIVEGIYETKDRLEFDKPSRNVLHPTQKPLDLIEYLIENSSRYGDIVCDPFLGSGSTLIAAHNTNRLCFGMELDERYATKILNRFEDGTGEKAELLSEDIGIGE